LEDHVRTVVVGAGPTGLFTAIALARRGREVAVIDRDPGPPQSGPPTVWQRKGVMQFHHAHTFRGQVVEALRAEMPDVLDDLITADATIATTAENRPVALFVQADDVRAPAVEPRGGTAGSSRSCAVMLTGSSTTAAGPSGSRSTAAR
jgi:2-polyprenyl-6-methoxyphenol hydroxylase-like FAD-dependent oxidoreductase